MKRAWLLALCWAGMGAHATGLWGFVDGQGVAHFAGHSLDPRYQLVLDDGPRRTTRRVLGKADAAASLLTWLDIAPEAKAVAPWLREAALASGVDAELLKAVIAVESGFNAQAISPRGAIGLMQITAETGERYAVDTERRVPVEQRLLDARVNIRTGARVLADLVRRLGRIDLALAAWNAGEGAVIKSRGMPPIDETRAHVHLVLELYWTLLQRSQAQRATALTLQ